MWPLRELTARSLALAARGDYAANTYWQAATDLDAQFGATYSPKRSLAREVSDEKPLNCTMPIMFAAFCAWDGDAELPTYADYLDVWPKSQVFPWGPNNTCTTPGGQGSPGNFKPCDAFNGCNGPLGNGGITCQNISLSATGEAGVFYEWPRNTNRANDNSPLIAAPGRFVKDVTLAKSGGAGWYDLMANLVEYTGDWVPSTDATLSTFCDRSAEPVTGQLTCTRSEGGVTATGTLHTGIPQVGVLGDSFEGHQYVSGTDHGVMTSKIPATFQYGKFGARCVRKASPY